MSQLYDKKDYYYIRNRSYARFQIDSATFSVYKVKEM